MVKNIHNFVALVKQGLYMIQNFNHQALLFLVVILLTIGFIPICLFIFGKPSFSKVFTPRCVSLHEPPAAPDWSNLIEFTNTKKPPNQNLGSIRFTIPNTFTAHAFNTHHQSSINTPRGKYFREAGFFKNKETYWNETDCIYVLGI